MAGLWRPRRRTPPGFAPGWLWLLIAALCGAGCEAHGQGARVPVARGPGSAGQIELAGRPRVSRVVPQLGVDPTSYQLTEPSGRFAVFDEVIVDLQAERVAWLNDGGVIPVQTAAHHLLRQHPQDTAGVELWDLLDGSTQLFPGTLVLHAPMAGRVALQRGPALDVIDVVQGQRVALLPALGEILSVVPSAGGWRILARTGTRREQPALVLLSTPPAPADGVQTLALELPSTSFSLAARSERSSDPFLVVAAHGELSVNVVESCAACSAPGQLSLWSSALDERTGRGGPWSERRFAPGQLPAGASPLEGPHVHVHSALPASVEAGLAGLRTTPELGVFLDVSPDARRLLTGTANRVCVWSLEGGERAWCEPRQYSTYQFLDATRVWMLGEYAGKTELGIWDLAQRRSSKRAFAPGSVTVVGPGEHFLLSSFDEQRRTHRVEAWAFAGQAPGWRREACGATPYFAEQGARVVCADPGGDDSLLLDATDGKEVGTVSSSGAPAPAPDQPARPCQLSVAQTAAAALTRHGRPVATLFDLTPTEWALVLPDGTFTGSAGAATYLAFYDAAGTPALGERVERLRDPGAVRGALASLQQALGGCTE
jgi:hypothetical protein